MAPCVVYAARPARYKERVGASCETIRFLFAPKIMPHTRIYFSVASVSRPSLRRVHLSGSPLLRGPLLYSGSGRPLFRHPG